MPRSWAIVGNLDSNQQGGQLGEVRYGTVGSYMVATGEREKVYEIVRGRPTWMWKDLRT